MASRSSIMRVFLSVAVVAGAAGLSGCTDPAGLIAEKDQAAVATMKGVADRWNADAQKESAAAQSAVEDVLDGVAKALTAGDAAGVERYLDAATVSLLGDHQGVLSAWVGFKQVDISDPEGLAPDLIQPPELVPALTEDEVGGRDWGDYADDYVPTTVDGVPADQWNPDPWTAPDTVDVGFTADGESGTLSLENPGGNGWQVKAGLTAFLDVPSGFVLAASGKVDWPIGDILKIGGEKVSVLYAASATTLIGSYKLSGPAGFSKQYATFPDTIDPFKMVPQLTATKKLKTDAISFVKKWIDGSIKLANSGVDDIFCRKGVVVNGTKYCGCLSALMVSGQSIQLKSWKPDIEQSSADISIDPYWHKTAGKLNGAVLIKAKTGGDVAVITYKWGDMASTRTAQTITLPFKINPATGSVSWDTDYFSSDVS